MIKMPVGQQDLFGFQFQLGNFISDYIKVTAGIANGGPSCF